ncbi:thiol reductant ABC exporter subunit CydD [Microbacterium lacticum]|uniref:ATP-binding cassette subfamily C protein CydD n=1 Tax=Microbacterium lacticum TaxID=33885 RepID=A0A4Y3UR91_9MICO|nr:thiol reductant ABC exporter subunit CydD [Microbacterium lacticum]TQM98829.1 ATP-binding cassette subfamily C protein CydD [Microbacterium lacticum]GEB96008.1 thiol reductant ABC exporter subunit CydD [Microbacterium lacticum]GGI71539.1 thiol reductant ABC exporter subunit CydD [Microbacterium lacticum]
MPDTDERPERTRVRPVDPRLLRYASASRGFFVAIAAVGALQTVVIVAFAWLMTAVITGVIAGRPWEEISGLLTALAAVVIVRGVLLWLREVICARAAARVEAQLRAQLLGAIGRLGPDWLAGRNTARLAVTAGRGLEALDTYFARYLPQLVLTVIATPIIIVVMWWQDWISGLTVILTIPLIPLFMVLIGLATRAVQQQQWQTLGTLAARFADTVRGLSTLKIFGRQHRAAASIERVTDAYRKETMRVLRVSFLSGFALELLASISVAIIAVSIGFRLIDGSLGLTVGLFVLLLAPEAYLPLRQVGVQFHAAAEGVAATEDLFEVLDAAAAVPGRVGAGAEGGAAAEIGAAADRSEVGSPQDGRSPQERGARVEVRGLRVRRGEALLAPVTFTAEPGTVTLIEGPSGSGKSSLLAALRGAASFEGDATVDGMPVSALSPTQWLAWCGQQPGLITGTIAENVTLGDADGVTDGPLVARALELAQAGDLDPRLSLGVQGAGLSGGQAQRVAIARAFFRHLRGRAPVLALDEPSSALDADTEAALWLSVRALADDGATVLLVSHRRTARGVADHVVRLHPQPAEVIA